MTPKEKAEKLIDKMKFHCIECDNNWKAKQCALIAVDEILNTGCVEVPYWFKVKQEIEKL